MSLPYSGKIRVILKMTSSIPKHDITPRLVRMRATAAVLSFSNLSSFPPLLLVGERRTQVASPNAERHSSRPMSPPDVIARGGELLDVGTR